VRIGLGLPELIILSLFLTPVLFGAVVLYGFLTGKRAKRFGYGSTREYLRAVPRSDLEKRDAVDLAMQGIVLCLLGLIFKPFVLVGLIPLYYGGRKLVYASMGLGLVDDSELPGA
jgi:hypothetical protein